MLTLIGATHFDLEAPKRVEAWLKKLAPIAIGIETSEADFYQAVDDYWATFETPGRIERAVKKYLNIMPGANPETIHNYLINFFRTEAVLGAYCIEHDIEPFFTREVSSSDSQGVLRKGPLLGKLEDYLSKTVNCIVLEADLEYARSHYQVEGLPFYADHVKNKDSIAERVIRENLKLQGTLYLCSLDNIYGDHSPNLYERLRDLNPNRVKLNEIGKQ